MEEDKRASSEVISWEVIFVLEIRRRKSANHWGEAWRGDEGLGFDDCVVLGERSVGYGVLVVEGLRNG